MLDLRSQFPSLKRSIDGISPIYLDGPAGTQVPKKVIKAISHYYSNSNANVHGAYLASKETDELVAKTRKACHTMINSNGHGSISFGPNMTTLAFSLSRAFSRILEEGDEIIITQLDHEANRGPWLTLKEVGVVIREIKMTPNGELDYEDLVSKVNAKTKLICVGWASNLFGTVNKISAIKKIAKESGAWLLIDAVHYAPHFDIDVTDLDCDFLLCSAYKFYGPHIGILYCKEGLLDSLPTDRLRTQNQKAPDRIESGTKNHAALAGVLASIEFMSTLGEGEDLGTKLRMAKKNVEVYERNLAKSLWIGLKDIAEIQELGPGFNEGQRAPTISFTHSKFTPQELCMKLAEHNIYAMSGHFYALRSMEVLGLAEKGGVTRMGMAIYNTNEEVLKTLDVLGNL